MKKDDLKIVALIPARSGSKRLPGKNIKDFCGKPLIAWTIEAALKSKYIDSVVVSTDCSKIAEISKQYGAEAPFIRPEAISKDETEIPEVIDHLLENVNESFTHLLLLQPTCPLRQFSDIDGAVELLVEKEANAIYSVCEVDHSPLWANTLPDDLSFDSFLRPEIAGIRSQNLPKYYRLNGSIYLVEINSYKSNRSLFKQKRSYAFIMNPKHSIDIDEEIDLIIGESICRKFISEFQVLKNRLQDH